MRGKRNCEVCGGKGVVPAVNGYRKCSCVTGTKAERDAMRRFNAIGAKYPDGDGLERLRSKNPLQER